MLTEKDLHSFLQEVGIKHNDTLLVHTSMRALGRFEGGCDGLIDAFISYLNEGLFLVPTHTWANVGKASPIYDVRTTEPCIGALPRVAAKRKDGVRSLHPTHSITAFGRRAEEFVYGEEGAISPCSFGGAWQRLYDEGAKILLIGVGLDRNTYIHAIDEMLRLPGRLATPTRLYIIDKNGKKHSTLFSPHGCTGSRFFENYRQPLEALGALKNERLGGAVVGIFDARRGTEVIRSLWEAAEYDLCREQREIPKEYYSEPERKIATHKKLDAGFAPGGARHIAEKIRAAIAKGCDRVTVTGHWEIDEEIRLPSGFTLILENCHLRMKDGCYSNMFVNQNHGTDLGKTAEGTDRYITIEGRGYAILDGGSYNGLSEKTQLKNGLPPIWKNCLILFTNVEGFRITGLSCRNQRWWAICFLYSRFGYLGRLDFESCDIGIDENGNEYRGLKQDKYSEILIKNADGIDLRRGCHNILIENITGFTEDDMIAMTGLDWNLEREFSVPDLPADISDITVRNIRAEAFCTIVRILNQDGIRLHDILVDGVYDSSRGSKHMDYGAYAARIGDSHLYGKRYPTPEETYNITLKNITGRGIAALSLEGAIKNLILDGITAVGNTVPIRDKRKT